jgi:NAD(P)-dependent dehydrogenase (short-subunit alcohol dehydrogenase family)
MSGLQDRVVIVDASRLDVARALAAEGAVVVLVGEGQVPADLGDARVGVFTGDLDDPADRAALAEFVAEIFPTA